MNLKEIKWISESGPSDIFIYLFIYFRYAKKLLTLFISTWNKITFWKN